MRDAGAKPRMKGSRGEAEKGARVTWKLENLVPLREIQETK
jgi:hypothetical protein